MLHFERFLFALVWKYITIHPKNVPVISSCQSEQTFAISQKYISAHWHHEGEGCNLSFQQTKGAWSRRQHSLVLSSLANTYLDMITLLCQWWWSHFQNHLHLKFWRKIKCIVWNWRQQFCQFHPLPSHLCNFIYFQVKKMHGMQTLDTIHSTADLKRKTMCCASWVLISCCCWVDLLCSPGPPQHPLPNITMIAMCCASWALIRFHRWVHLFPQEDTPSSFI